MKPYLNLILIAVILGSFSGIGRMPTPARAREDTHAIHPIDDSSHPAQSMLNTDQIIIKYKPSFQANNSPNQAGQMQRMSAAAGVSLAYQRAMSGDAHVLRLPARLPDEQVQQIVARLMALPEVEYAEPDQIMQHTLVPNDPSYASQWHYFAPSAGNYGINAPAAWDINQGSASVVVAVVDTGYRDHADLAGRFVQGYDFVNDSLVANDGDGRDSDAHDPGDWITAAESLSGYFVDCPVSNSSWHGTHVAGTIGANSNNSAGVAGINWNAKILPVRVLGKCGGYDSDIIDGVRWAAGLPVTGVPANTNPAKVINLSLGGTGACSTAMQNAINAVTVAGTTMVVAAGNSYSDAKDFSPASCNGVITVAATDRNGSRAWYSNYGSKVEISAPGGDTSYYGTDGILSTLNSGTQSPAADAYAYYQGTSMAAPHVTGVVSLIYSGNPTITPAQVLSILQSTVTTFPPGSTCTTSDCGSGIVNAGAAITALGIPNAFNKSAPANGAIEQPASPTLSWNANPSATSYEYCFNTSAACSGGWTSAGNNTSASPSGLQSGTTYYWQVRARNAAGINEANGGTWWSFTITPPPTVTGFLPANGPVGTNVTITGTKFTGATKVQFNGVDAIFTVNSPTEIQASVPAGATTGKISVVTPNGIATSSSNFRVGTFVQFSSPMYSVNEAGGPANILVTLNASSTQPITVSYTTINGTATASQDYTTASGTLTFPPGTTKQTLELAIINDTLDEVDETVSIQLSNPINAELGIPGEATLTISDDDPAPSVSFNPGSYTVSESSGTVTTTVRLTAASGKPITIGYSTSDGTATKGVDYTAVSGLVTFAPGVTTMNIPISILADTLYEGDETFILSLSNPVNATLASPSVATFKIIDLTRRIYLPITMR